MSTLQTAAEAAHTFAAHGGHLTSYLTGHLTNTAGRHLHTVGGWILAAPPTPTPSGPAVTKNIDTNGIISFLGTRIAPILLAVLGVVFIGWARGGDASRVATSSGIAIVGVAFIVGAGIMLAFGGTIINTLFT